MNQKNKTDHFYASADLRKNQKRPETTYTVIPMDGSLRTVSINKDFRFTLEDMYETLRNLGGTKPHPLDPHLEGPYTLRGNQSMFDPKVFGMYLWDVWPAQWAHNPVATKIIGRDVSGPVLIIPHWSCD